MNMDKLIDAEVKTCQCAVPIWDAKTNAEVIKGVTVYHCFNCNEIVPVDHYYCDASHTKYSGSVLESYLPRKVNNKRLFICGTCNKFLVNQRGIRLKLALLLFAVLVFIDIVMYLVLSN